MAKRIENTSRPIVGHMPEIEITPTEPSRRSRKGEEVIPPEDHEGAGTGKGGRENQRCTCVQYTEFIE